MHMTDEAMGVPSGTNRAMSEWTWQDYLNWGQEINQERMEADWKGLWADVVVTDADLRPVTVLRRGEAVKPAA